jgi:DNA-binding response OmpR family regulator
MEIAGKVLIVDDDRNILKIMSYAFKTYGFEVRTCENSTEAMLWALAEASDYVVTDYNMPGMNGLELARRLRQHLPATVIIGMSAQDRGMEFLHSGANDFWQKPFAPYDLVMMIDGRDQAA